MAQETASLKISVDSRDVKNADKDLNKFEQSSRKTQKSSDQLNTSFSSLKGSAIGLASSLVGLYSINELSKAFLRNSDAATQMNSKLKLVTTSAENLDEVQRRLFNVAQDSNAVYTDAVELYARLARSTKQLGTPQKDLLTITETINKAMIVSGATTQEASNSVFQLSKAFMDGTLRAEEYNSIIDQAPRLVQAMADSANMSMGEFRQAMLDGKISSEFMSKALVDQASTIDGEYAQMGKTIGNSMVLVKNSLLDLVDTMENDFKIGSTIAGETQEMSKWITQNKAELIDWAQDIKAVGTLVADGLENIYLAAQMGYAEFYLMFQKEIDSILKEIIDTVNQTGSFWADLFGKDFTPLEGLRLDVEATTKLIKENNNAILENEKSSNKAWLELATGAEKYKENINALSDALDESLSYKISDGGRFFSKEELEQEKKDYFAMIDEIEAKEQEAIDTRKALVEEAMNMMMSPMEVALNQFQTLEEAMISAFGTGSKEMEKFYSFWGKKIEEISKKQDEGTGFKGIDSGDWISGLEGTAKSIANVSKALSQVQEENELWNEFKKDNVATSEDEEKHNKNLIGLYGNLAGSMSNAYEDGSRAAIAFGMVQKSMALIDGVGAVVKAWNSAIFPANIPAVVATGAAVASLLSQIGVGFSALGGGGGSAPSASEQRLDAIDMEFTPITDRLDAQIDLLEKISLQGTSGRVELSRLAVESARAAQETFAKTLRGGDFEGAIIAGNRENFSGTFNRNVDIKYIKDIIENSMGALNFSDIALGDDYHTYINIPEFIKQVNELLEFELLSPSTGLYDSVGLQIENIKTFSDAFATMDLFRLSSGAEKADEAIAELTNNFLESAGGMAELAQGLLDFRDTMGDLYDDMTGTNTFSSIKMQEARASLSEMGINTDEEVIAESKRVFDALGAVQKEYGLELKEVLANIKTLDPQESADKLAELETLLAKFYSVGENADPLSVVDILDRAEAIELLGASIAKIGDERRSLQETYDLLTGVITQRELELQSIDKSNQKLQEAIWLEEDRQKALDEEIRLAAQAYDEQIRITTQAYDEQTRLAEKAAAEHLRMLETTYDNIRSLTLSFLDAGESAQFLADELGVNLAQDFLELSDLTKQLANDADGLTSADMQLINANKSLIESFTDVSGKIDTLEGVIDTIGDVIEKLRGGAESSTDSLSKFYNAMSEAQSLASGDNFDSFSEAVNGAITASSALFEASNFQNQRDMDFAQLVAANQFEGLEDTALTQIDYLELIEENTRNQINVLVEAMEKLGADVKSSIKKAPKPSTTKTEPALSASEQLVSSAYQAIFNRAPDDEGLSYWSGRVESGSVNLSNLSTTLVAGAAVNPSAQSATDYLVAKAQGYSQGGYTGDIPVNQFAGITHGKEFVIDAPNTAKLGLNQNMGNVFSSMEVIMQKIESIEGRQLRYLEKIEYNTTKSRVQGIA